MEKEENNYAFIDGNNLYRGVNNSGWKIDFFRFRKWLKDKYGVDGAYYFISDARGQSPKTTSCETTPVLNAWRHFSDLARF